MKYVLELDYDPVPKLYDSVEEALDAAEQYMKDDAEGSEVPMNVLWRLPDPPYDCPLYDRATVISKLPEMGEISLASVGTMGPQEVAGLTLIVATEEHYKKSVEEANEGDQTACPRIGKTAAKTMSPSASRARPKPSSRRKRKT
jgi:hypothetical protein